MTASININSPATATSSAALERPPLYTEERLAVYREITCRLKPNELASIERNLTHLIETNKMDAGIESLKRFTPELLDDRNFPYYVLEACRRGNISQQQFGTFQIFWSAKQRGEIFCTNISYDESFSLITSTFDNLFKDQEKLFGRQIGEHLTAEQIERFKSQMEKLPPSEQTFFYAFDQTPEELNLSTLTIPDVLKLNLGFNIFGSDGSLRIIPSIGMMEIFLQIYRDDPAIKLNPVLGRSNLAQWGRSDSIRDIAVRFPEVALSDVADNLPAPGESTSYHDFYHATVALAAPQKYRERFVQIRLIAEELARPLEKKSPERLTLRALVVATSDCEWAFFHELKTSTLWADGTEEEREKALETAFWMELEALSIKSLSTVDFEKFDVSTLIRFYLLVAERLKESLVPELLPPIIERKTPFPTSELNLLERIYNFLTGKETDPRKIELGTQARFNVLKAKFLSAKFDPDPEAERPDFKALKALGLEYDEARTILFAKMVASQTMVEDLLLLLGSGVSPNTLLEMERSTLRALVGNVAFVSYLLQLGVPLEAIHSHLELNPREREELLSKLTTDSSPGA